MKNMKKLLSFVLGLVLLYPVVMGAKICQFSGNAMFSPDGTSGCETSLDTLRAPDSSQGPLANANSAQNLSFTSKDLGWQWPITIGAQYSKLGNYMLQAKVAQGFNAYNAFALAMELGKSQRRYSGTYGHAFDQQQRLKVTAEYLKQNLDFNFTTGTATEWVGQAAYGAAYQYVLPKGILNAINLSVGFSKADNKALSTITDTVAGTADYRRIAGAEDRMASAGIDLLPTKTSLLGLALNYDSVNYDTKYQTVINQNTVGFGATASLEQLVTDVLKFKISASTRKPYKEYQAEVDWLLPTAYGTRWEMAFTGGFTRGGTDGLSNDSRFGVNVNYSFDANPNSTRTAAYTIGSRKILGDDLVQWTSTPAVYMAQVLAVKDELMLQLSGIAPNCGSIAGGTNITINGSNLTDNLGATSGTLPVVLVGGAQATGVAVSGSSITAVTPAHAAGAVDVTVTTPSGRSVTKSGAYTYNAGVCEFLTSSNGVGSSSGLYGLDGGELEIDARCGNSQALLAASGANDSPSPSVTIDGVPAKVVSFDGNNVKFRTPHGPSEESGKMGKPLDVVIVMGGVTYTMPAAFTYYGIKAKRETASNSNDQRGAYLVTSNPVASVPIFASDVQVKLNGQVVPSTSYVNNRNSLTLQPNAALKSGLKLKAGLNGQREVSIAVRNQDPRGLQDRSDTKIEDDYPSLINNIDQDFSLSGGGKAVTINGGGFTLDNQGVHKVDVYWGPIDSSNKLNDDEYSVVSANQIKINKVRSGTGTVNITVKDPGGDSTGTFTYHDVSLSNDSGTENDTIDIQPTKASEYKIFDSEATVTFQNGQDVASPKTTTVDPGQQKITIAVPKLKENTKYDIVVTNPNSKDKATLLAAFTYLGNLTVTGVEPNAGFATGGKLVTVKGSNFRTKQGVTTTVKFGEKDGTEIVVKNDKEIQVKTPSDMSAGSCKVTVTQVDGSSTFTDTKSDVFTAYNTLDLDRKSGPAAGGYDVKLIAQGNVFDATASDVTVQFGEGTPVTAKSSTGNTLVVTVPEKDKANEPTPVDVTVTNKSGDSLVLPNAFRYNDNPEIDHLSSDVSLVSGKEIKIFSKAGYAFDTSVPTTVVVGNSNPITPKAVSAESIIVTVPSMSEAGATAGIAVPITVKQGSAESTLPNAFTYYNKVTLDKDHGSALGGTVITFTADKAVFDKSADDVEVDFGKDNPGKVTGDTGNTLTVTTPAKKANDPVTVVVKIKNKKSGDSLDLTGVFAYNDSPQIAGLSSNVSLPSGGKEITISSDSHNPFDPALPATVTIGSGEPAKATTVTTGEIKVTISAAKQEDIGVARDVTVKQEGYADATLKDGFTYTNKVTLDKDHGSALGGTVITFTADQAVFDKSADDVEVDFGKDNPGKVTGDTGNTLTVTTPVKKANDPSPVVITIKNKKGGDSLDLSGAFSYNDSPKIAGLSSNVSLPSGKEITISSDSHNPFDSALPATVVIGSGDPVTVPKEKVTAGEIKVTISAAKQEDIGVARDVTVKQEGYADAVLKDGFTYTDKVTLDKDHGSALGGTVVTFTADKEVFDKSSLNDVEVDFGKDNPGQVTGDTGNTLTVITPAKKANDPAPVVVKITNKKSGDSLELTGVFAYNDSSKIDRLSSYVSLPSGKKEISIFSDSHNPFDPAVPATVIIGSGDPAKATTVTAGEIKVTISAAKQEDIGVARDVTVKQEGYADATLKDGFTYTNKVTLDKDHGSALGGTVITFTADKAVFDKSTDDVEVDFGTDNPGIITGDTGNTLTVTTPAKKANDPVTVVVKIKNKKSGDSLDLTGVFAYNDSPQIAGLSSNVSLPSGGKEITISSDSHNPFDPALPATVIIGSGDPVTVPKEKVTAGEIKVTISAAKKEDIGVVRDVTVKQEGYADAVLKDGFTYYNMKLDPINGSASGKYKVKIQATNATAPIFKGATVNVKIGEMSLVSTVTVNDTGDTATIESMDPSTDLIHETPVTLNIASSLGDSGAANFTYTIPKITSVTRFGQPALALNGGGQLPEIASEANKGMVAINGEQFGNDKAKITIKVGSNSKSIDASDFDLVDQTKILIKKLPSESEAGTADHKADVHVFVSEYDAPKEKALEYVGASYNLKQKETDLHNKLVARTDGGDDVKSFATRDGENPIDGFVYDGTNSYVSFGSLKGTRGDVTSRTGSVTVKTPAYGYHKGVSVNLINGSDETYEHATVASKTLDFRRVYIECLPSTDADHSFTKEELEARYADGIGISDEAGNHYGFEQMSKVDSGTKYWPFEASMVSRPAADSAAQHVFICKYRSNGRLATRIGYETTSDVPANTQDARYEGYGKGVRDQCLVGDSISYDDCRYHYTVN